MSFDGILLTRLNEEFSYLKTGRISKITESGDTDFVLTIRVQRVNYNLMLSFSSDYSRIHITTKLYDSIQNPKSFTMFLRKHIEGYFIEDIKVHNNDRIIYFVLKGYNEMQDLNTKYLICEIMGRYSNMILTNEDYTIIDALKHDGIGEYNRTILPNALYEFPKTSKVNPLSYSKDELFKLIDEKKLSTPKDYINTFNGVSMNILNPIFQTFDPKEAFYNYLHIDNEPVIIKNFKGKEDFYYNPFNEEVIKKFDTLSSLLDDYFYEADLKSKVRAKTNDLASFINKQLKKYEAKIEKLNIELQDTTKMDEYKLYGELLLSSNQLKEKKESIIINNYYTNQDILIKLDNKYNVVDNSKRYFKKYQKLKNSIGFINEQIKIAQDEIEYFTLLKYQIQDASINEALEIQDELIQNKYLFKHVNNTNNKKKLKPKLLTYVLDNGTTISVGKNNLQNEYLTHKLAKTNEMWFHVKGSSGSHVVVHNEFELTEDEIRTAALLAAYYSSFKDSSSVPVDYTRIKFIKKIPGKRACFVTYKNQHTIYIDPNKDLINNLKVKK